MLGSILLKKKIVTSILRCTVSTTPSPVVTIGFIGLGHMGSKMVSNLAQDGHTVITYDRNAEAIKKVIDANPSNVMGGSIADIAEKCSVIFSMLPNDDIVEGVSQELLKHYTSKDGKQTLHISCSTVSPTIARKLQGAHHQQNMEFISSPVFARPDGISKREATFMLSGNPAGKEIAKKYLALLGRTEDIGEEIGAANVVKLCGNFLIATSIESIAEAMALAEKNGVDRELVMNLLSSSIFNCLIFKGYGQRVSQRDHKPGGFSLELGYKDVSLVNKAARDVNVPMPFLSTLVDRFTSAKAKNRTDMDWSAIGLNVAEDAGIDISKDLQKNYQAIEDAKKK